MIEAKPFYTCKYDKAFKEIMMKEENLKSIRKHIRSNNSKNTVTTTSYTNR